MKEWIEKVKEKETAALKDKARGQSYTEYPVTLRLIAEIERLEASNELYKGEWERLCELNKKLRNEITHLTAIVEKAKKLGKFCRQGVIEERILVSFEQALAEHDKEKE